jgi:hypothetical protein
LTPTMQDTIRSMTYRVPDGRVDAPYCYIYDASALTDSTANNSSNQLGLVTLLDNDSEFQLRRVAGMNLCLAAPGALAGVTGAWNAYDKSGDLFFQSEIQPGTMPAGLGGGQSGSWPVLPEKQYLSGNHLRFQLYGILRNFTADTTPTSNRNIYNSQIGFWGTRRFAKSNFYTYRTKYEYHELPYTYQFGLGLNWAHWANSAGAGIANSARKFQVPVLEVDFELCGINVTYIDGTPVLTNDFQFQLYAPDGYTLLSSDPMNLAFFNGVPGKANNTSYQYGSPVYPTPTLVYPVKSNIKFEITSMLPYGTQQSYVINFVGIWRARN